MNSELIKIAGIDVLVTRKKIRNLHLRICPPNAEVRASIPLRYSLDQARAIIQKVLPAIPM